MIIIRIFIGFDFTKARYWYTNNFYFEFFSYLIFLLPIIYGVYSINKFKKFNNPIKKSYTKILNRVMFVTFLIGFFTQVILPIYIPEFIQVQIFNFTITLFVVFFYFTFVRSVYDSSNLFNLIVETTPMAMYFTNKELLIIGCNNHFLHLIDKNKINKVIGFKFKKFMDFIDDDDLITIDQDIILNGTSYNKIVKESKQNHRIYEINKNPIFDENKIIGVLTTLENITHQMLIEDKLKTLSFRDSLTGLYNRTYYNELINKLNKENKFPLSIVMIDINSLKMINDVFTHNIGDELLVKISNIINKNIPDNASCCRIGGDEYVIIIPNTSADQALSIMKKIQIIVAETTIKGIHISISYGISTKISIEESLNEIITKADISMYKQKSINSQAVRISQIEQIMEIIKTKFPKQYEHSLQVSKYCEYFARQLHFPEKEIENFRLIGYFHDIGKIAIEPSLLNKKEKFTSDEYNFIKRHSELGYIIMKSCNKYQGYAEAIYHHHEKYDGSGYPGGLNGNNIPFNSRFLYIVEKLCDHLTNHPYRNSFSIEQVLDYLQENSGTLFDPDLCNFIVTDIKINGLPK
jgi:diguanylate cyclase (GGDEF)-like protein/putative nucleotidyltransferase with HDIG domain